MDIPTMDVFVSKDELLDIIGLLPENALSEIILEQLRIYISTKEWKQANEILEHIFSLENQDTLKAESMKLGVLLAVRTSDLHLALQRYEMLCGFGKTGENLSRRAEALFHLSDILLPDKPSELAGLWLEIRVPDLPRRAQDFCAILSMMLCRQFYRNSDMQNCRHIGESMKANLDSAELADKLPELEKLVK